MSAQHTQGRLTVEGYGGVYVNIVDERGGDVADAVLKDDASRLVACWNACNGVSTENLEQGPSFLEALTQKTREILEMSHVATDAKRELATARALLAEVLPHINPAASKWTEGGIEFLKDKVCTFLAAGAV